LKVIGKANKNIQDLYLVGISLTQKNIIKAVIEGKIYGFVGKMTQFLMQII
jgi:hypothetical protein